jgi:hypothetical protein
MASVAPDRDSGLPFHGEDAAMNTSLRFGLPAGAILCVLMFAPYFLFGARTEWMRAAEIVGYGSMLLCLSATWFAMQREQARRGPLGFGAALRIGIAVSTVAALLFGAATWAFYAVVGDALPEALLAYYADQVRNAGTAPEVTAQRLQELEAMRPFFYNRPLQGAVMAATVFVIGAFESLVGAWITARRGRSTALATG